MGSGEWGVGNGDEGDEGDEGEWGVWGAWGERFLSHPPTPPMPHAQCPVWPMPNSRYVKNRTL